jgi:hypothetical protein
MAEHKLQIRQSFLRCEQLNLFNISERIPFCCVQVGEAFSVYRVKN